MSLADIKNRAEKKGNHIDISEMEQLKTVDLIGLPILTMMNCELITTKNGPTAIVIFKEYKNSFYFAGKALTGLCSDIIADQEAYDEMIKDGVKIQLYKKESQDGRDYVAYKFI